ncbi:PD-(D/E)XK nuclease family protein [Thermonema rossianum]|uniref:PD-(D/E)XK nuclease family protein n=1 Tax=Thermonema rossianum TaxID=55505 RepID=UPI000570EA10|nr:PD-(D/E)XK nuclease family protein [Thermonema rossianum]
MTTTSSVLKETFIHKLLEAGGAHAGREVVFLLPTKRAAKEIKRLGGEAIQAHAWEDFMLKIAARQLGIQTGHQFSTPEPQLLICLYECLHKELKEKVTELWHEDDAQEVDEEAMEGEVQRILNERIASFLARLLQDFIALDEALVDVRDILRNLKELKDLEYLSVAWQDDEQLRKAPPSVRRQVLLYRSLPEVYERFQEMCQKKRMAHKGQLWRAWAKHAPEWFEKAPGDLWVVAGLNQLSQAEIEVLKKLQKAQKVQLYWESDDYYHEGYQKNGTEEQKLPGGKDWHPVGRRLKQFCEKTGAGPAALIKSNHLAQGSKECYFVSVPMASMQTHVVRDIVKGKGALAGKLNFEPGSSIGIVLVDTFLLPAFIRALKESKEDELAVSMGVALTATPAYQLMQSIFQLHFDEQWRVRESSLQEEESDTDAEQVAEEPEERVDASAAKKETKESRVLCYYHAHINAVLTHPYIYVLLGRRLRSQGLGEYALAQALIQSFLKEMTARRHAYVSKKELVDYIAKAAVEKAGASVAEAAREALMQLFQSFIQELFTYWKQGKDVSTSAVRALKGLTQELKEAMEEKAAEKEDADGQNEAAQRESEAKKAIARLDVTYLEEMQNLFAEIEQLLADAQRNSVATTLGFLRGLFQQMTHDRFVYPDTSSGNSRIHLLGLSESRLLDFDNLIFVTANEGYLPAEVEFRSLLPYAFHKELGLPLPEEQMMKTTQDVYRLLHHARKIVMMQVENDDYEPSRYLYQIEDELCVYNRNISLQKIQLRLPQAKSKAEETFAIKKDGEVIGKIREYLEKNGLSPSALDSYLSCPLRFYFSYVLKFKKEDEISEELENNEFGTVLHAVLEKLFKNYEGKEITQEELDKWLSDAVCDQASGVPKGKPVIKQMIEQELTKRGQTNEGSGLLAKVALETIIERFLHLQKKEMGNQKWSIEGLELRMEEEKRIVLPVEVEGLGRVEARLKGIIDRADKRMDPQTGQEVYYVIDYKSGRVRPKDLQLSLDDLDALFSHDPKSNGLKSRHADYSKVRQLLIYTFLYLEYLRSRQQQKPPRLYAGIYSFRNLADELMLLEEEKGEAWDIRQKEEELKEAIRKVIAEMLDKEKEIRKVEDVQRCTYCDYKVICQRKHAS